jgi:small subunit ribosomal protein S8
MAQYDSIGDIIIRLKNAVRTRKETVVFPNSKLTASVTAVLERLGFLEIIQKKVKKSYKNNIEAKLAYTGNVPKFRDARRISKFSKRIYRSIKDVSPVKNGFGHSIISTPKGIITDSEARKEKVGGEVLFQVW